MSTRINKFVAQSTGVSRRVADELIKSGTVSINGRLASIGESVTPTDIVNLHGRVLELPNQTTTIMLHKPTGYVSSRHGQSAPTIYDLIPKKFHSLKPVGRLDKDSSGLLLLSNDGELAYELTHPKHQKTKLYSVTLNKALLDQDARLISDGGVKLNDGQSTLGLSSLDGSGKAWLVEMNEGRNRQIRRTFEAIGYTVKTLHRLQFGPYKLGQLESGNYVILQPRKLLT